MPSTTQTLYAIVLAYFDLIAHKMRIFDCVTLTPTDFNGVWVQHPNLRLNPASTEPRAI